jgi:hypothetical protein
MARRDDREYREYLWEEQRCQPGCPARKALLVQRIRATSVASGQDSSIDWRLGNIGNKRFDGAMWMF